jgi:hypothetical protein
MMRWKQAALVLLTFLLPHYSSEAAQSTAHQALSLVKLLVSPITSPKLTNAILSCRKNIVKSTLYITVPLFAMGILGNAPQLSKLSFMAFLGAWFCATALAIPPLGVQSLVQAPPKSAQIYFGCCALLGIIGAYAYHVFTMKIRRIEAEQQDLEATRLLTFNRALQEAAKKNYGCRIDLTQAPTREFLAFTGYQPSQIGYKKLSKESVKAVDDILFRPQRALFEQNRLQISDLLKNSIAIGSLLIAGHSILLGMQKLEELDRWIM